MTILKTYQKDIFKLMIKQESLMAKLYTLFAEQFPEHGEVWNELVKEEKKHAGWLKQLYEAEEKGIVLFDEGKVKTYTMKAYIEYLEQIIVRAENNELTLAQAITYTLDFERSLIEKNIFTHFDSTSEKAKSVLKRLTVDIESHIKRVRLFCDDHGQHLKAVHSHFQFSNLIT